MASISSFAALVSSFPVVGFSGSRQVGSVPARLAAEFCGGFGRGFSGRVRVGCARGVDAAVRGAFPSASVFSVAASEVSRLGAAAFAARSAALVQSVAGSRGVLVAFPLGACPSEVAPSRSFRGCGSGSWGSVALALGLGCPVLLVVSGSELSAPSSVCSLFSCMGSGRGFSVWFAGAPVPEAVTGSGVQGSLF